MRARSRAIGAYYCAWKWKAAVIKIYLAQLANLMHLGAFYFLTRGESRDRLPILDIN
jgi:hypothetical protein